MTTTTRCEHDAPAWACRICTTTEPCPDDCPYCAGDMCARFDGLGCTHNAVERHGYDALANPDPLRPLDTDTDPSPHSPRCAVTGAPGEECWCSVPDEDRGLWVGWVLILAAFALGYLVARMTA